MRRLPVVLGIVFALVGLVWTLQGANLIGGSFMSGDPVWLVIGIALLIVSGALFVLGVRSSPGKPA